MSKIDKKVKHPTSFPAKIIEAIDSVLLMNWKDGDLPPLMLDPLAGIGGISELKWTGELHGVEIEAEWAAQAEERGVKIHHGDSRDMPWADGYFGCICTSPAYGNRIADSYSPNMSNPMEKRRRTYRIYLGRKLTEGNGAALQWGRKYRRLHRPVLVECWRVLAHGGWFILNIKNHYRRHTFQDVAKWYVETLEDLGFVVVEVRKVAMNGDQNTAAMRKHGQKTVDHELVVLLRKPFLGPNQPAAGV